MFQYALGRYLALKHQTQLKLDVSYFSTQKKRSYELSVFNIKESFATPEEIKTLSGRNPSYKETLFSLLFNRPKTYIRKRGIKFYPHILNLPDNVYLDGYWQSEKYFIDAADIIRKDFIIKTPQIEKNSEFTQAITSTDSVNIHFRRGDYIADSKTQQYHGICSFEYYDRCLEILKQKIKRPYLFIFSDDMDWVRKNFIPHFPAVYIDPNTDRAFEDLQLMSQCKHHIIANSSFSWWGAWLSSYKEKIVFAPKQWCKNKKKIEDIIPSDWIKV